MTYQQDNQSVTCGMGLMHELILKLFGKCDKRHVTKKRNE